MASVVLLFWRNHCLFPFLWFLHISFDWLSNLLSSAAISAPLKRFRSLLCFSLGIHALLSIGAIIWLWRGKRLILHSLKKSINTYISLNLTGSKVTTSWSLNHRRVHLILRSDCSQPVKLSQTNAVMLEWDCHSSAGCWGFIHPFDCIKCRQRETSLSTLLCHPLSSY